MPPNSTQNLNARLFLTATNPRRPAASIKLAPPPIQTSGPTNQIVGPPARYRGGYHLSF